MREISAWTSELCEDLQIPDFCHGKRNLVKYVNALYTMIKKLHTVIKHVTKNWPNFTHSTYMSVFSFRESGINVFKEL